jgi:hypothetical protein
VHHEKVPPWNDVSGGPNVDFNAASASDRVTNRHGSCFDPADAVVLDAVAVGAPVLVALGPLDAVADFEPLPPHPLVDAATTTTTISTPNLFKLNRPCSSAP